MSVLKEIKEFSPEKVVGGYARTKAEATQAVLAAVQGGLDAVIVQPSGIIGPYDHSGNHLVQLVTDYLGGRIPVCVKGGYDLVDVRDVAYGLSLIHIYYIDMFHDKVFFTSFFNNLIYLVIVVVMQLSIGLLFAILLTYMTKRVTLVKTCLLYTSRCV